ncbi:lactonase family protein [Bacteroides sp. K03]|uniref:lactonase family protein n=1 Tax=Bacteroides TaxID=816 RepID=UPI001C8B85F5|nr:MULTISPECIES: lactonase family protein [Bacteroides]MBX9186937.1 lactonase family protein [Bacteroides sp. K03]
MFRLVIGLCAASMLSSACTTRNASQQRAEHELTMLVGTYTSGSSKGIYTFRFNEESGVATPLSEIEVSNPSYLTLSPDNRFVYAVSEENDTTASINAFAFDKEKGTLTLLNKQRTKGEDPCYVATDGKKVLTANYSGGTMSVFPIRYDGSLESVDTLFQGTASGPDLDRQATPHIHCTLFSPDGNYIFATDFSADRILRYAVHSKEELPRPLSEAVNIQPGSGPRHLIFSKDGKYAYLINELSGKVIAFTYSDGRLNEIQTIVADTIQARGSADIHLSPDGRYLYASNRLKEDGIAIFEVNPEKGTLAKVGYQLTGLHPRHFNITPNGKFLLVACRDSNMIQVFERDTVSGLLKNTGKDIKMSKPVCIQFAKNK